MRRAERLPGSEPGVREPEEAARGVVQGQDQTAPIEAEAADGEARGQLELFGVLLSNFAKDKAVEPGEHCITIDEDTSIDGTWEEILQKMSEARGGNSSKEFMQTEARRGFSLTGHLIPTEDAERFIRGSADAGLLRIVR